LIYALAHGLIQCVPCKACFRGSCIGLCCIISGFCVLITLGVSSYPRHCFEYWREQIGPWILVALLVLWAHLCPILFTSLYSRAIGAHSEEFREGWWRTWFSSLSETAGFLLESRVSYVLQVDLQDSLLPTHQRAFNEAHHSLLPTLQSPRRAGPKKKEAHVTPYLNQTAMRAPLRGGSPDSASTYTPYFPNLRGQPTPQRPGPQRSGPYFAYTSAGPHPPTEAPLPGWFPRRLVWLSPYMQPILRLIAWLRSAWLSPYMQPILTGIRRRYVQMAAWFKDRLVSPYMLKRYFLMMPSPVDFRDDVKLALRQFDPDAYHPDFGPPSRSSSSPSSHLSAPVHAHEPLLPSSSKRFHAEQIAIVWATLKFQVNLVLFQFLLMVACRYCFQALEEGTVVFGRENLLMGLELPRLQVALRTTLEERTFHSYVNAVGGKILHGINSTEHGINSTARYVNTVWGAL